MKFLVISQQKDPLSPAPKTVRENSLKDIEQRMKDGKILAMYYIPGWNKTISIEEHDNNEEVYEVFKETTKYNNFEIYPLVDFALRKETLINM